MKYSNQNEDKINKRKKIEITTALKKRIQKHYKENKELNPKYTQINVAEFFKAELGYLIPSSTMSDILKKKLDDDDNRFRNRPALYPKLEDALVMYYYEKFYLDPKNLLIQDEAMIEKAKNYFGPMLGITDFKYSKSWFSSFKKRYNLVNKELMKNLLV